LKDGIGNFRKGEEKEFLELLKLMLSYDPIERPSPKDLLNHPFLNKWEEQSGN